MSQQPFQVQDDILQMMYWMRGEQIGDHVAPEQLNRFLGADPALLQNAIGRLVERGLLEQCDERFRLTAVGIEEGKRRFLDEFTSYLGKDSHLSCSDPECDCRNEEWDGVCRTGV